MRRIALLVWGLFVLTVPGWAVEPAQSAKARAAPRSTENPIRYLPDRFAGRAALDALIDTGQKA